MHSIAFALVITLTSQTLAQDGKRHALLVGISTYQSVEIEDLHYAERDMTELRDVLAKTGFDVTLLTNAEGKTDSNKAPTKANIDAALKRVLASAGKNDVLLVALSGRGCQADFYPYDALPNAGDASNLLPLDDFAKAMHTSAVHKKMLLVDAAHVNDLAGPDDFKAPDCENFTAILSLHSVETKRAGGGHGVFFHHVIEGLRGKAVNADGIVTDESLERYLELEIPAFAEKWRLDKPWRGWISVVLSIGQKATFLAKPVTGPELEVYSSAAYSLLIPKGWNKETGSSENHEWAVLTSKGVMIRVHNDSAGIGDILAGPNRGVKMADPTLEVIHGVHLGKMETVAEDCGEYKEDKPVPFNCKLGMGRWSAFSGTEGTLFKTKIRGIRATIQSATKTVVLRCKCQESQWREFKPVFVSVVTNVGPGKQK